MDGFVVPVAYDLGWQGPSVPRVLEQHVSAGAQGHQEAAGISTMFGSRHFKPTAPILLVGPDGRVPILLIADGDTEAAELEDLAQEAINQQEEQLAAGGRGMDFDKLREKHGQVRREDVDVSIREAIQRRIDHHKANPVTDPFREPRQILGNRYPMSRAAGWVEGRTPNVSSV